MNAKTLERYFYDTNIDSSVLSTHFRRSKVYQDAIIEPYESGRFYIFMTRPDMNLNVANLRAMDRLGQNEADKENEILQLLTNQLYKKVDGASLGSQFGSVGGHFINLITNLHKTAPLKDIVADAKNAFETYDGYGMVLGGHSKDSRSKGEFSITYNETKDLEIMKLHSIWNQYIDFASEGLVSRTKDNRDKHILDYASSLYVFAVEPDGETISFWAKFSGVIPLGVPWTALGEQLGESTLITPTINYKYTYYEDNTLDILRDFTNLTSNRYNQSNGQKLYKGKDNGGKQGSVPTSTPKIINNIITPPESYIKSGGSTNINSYEDTYLDPPLNSKPDDTDNSFYKDNGYIYQDYSNVQIIKETSRYKLKFYGAK